MVVVHSVYFITMLLNIARAANGILEKFSPREIVTERQIDVKKDCRAMFDAYVEASTDADVTNDITPRTHGYLCLEPHGNLQGS